MLPVYAAMLLVLLVRGRGGYAGGGGGGGRGRPAGGITTALLPGIYGRGRAELTAYKLYAYLRLCRRVPARGGGGGAYARS